MTKFITLTFLCLSLLSCEEKKETTKKNTPSSTSSSDRYATKPFLYPSSDEGSELIGLCFEYTREAYNNYEGGETLEPGTCPTTHTFDQDKLEKEGSELFPCDEIKSKSGQAIGRIVVYDVRYYLQKGTFDTPSKAKAELQCEGQEFFLTNGVKL